MGETMMFDNREIATGIWLVVILGVALSLPKVRRPLLAAMKDALAPKIVLPVIVLWGYIAIVVWQARRVGLWDMSLAKDTIVWCVTAAIAPFVAIKAATKEAHFFLRGVKTAVGADITFEYVMNLEPFSLGWELALQPILFFLVGMITVAEHKPEYRRTKSFLQLVLVAILVAIVVHTGRSLYDTRAQLDGVAMLRDFGLAVWLSIAILPAVYVVALWATYEVAFLRIDWATGNAKARLRAKLAIVVGLAGRARDIDRIQPYLGRKAGEAKTFREAVSVVHDFKRSLREQERAKRQFEENLVKFAGSDELDEEGRRRDVREFKATRDALRWIHNCHIGWYRREARYRADLMKIFHDDFTRHGLPEDHGIKMHVSADGQSWYAWRRTVSGWCFAIGARGKPSSQWLYDGPEPPVGFPGDAAVWGPTEFSDACSKNWFGNEL